MSIKTISIFLLFIINFDCYSQENCGNGVDDDGDGMADCLDPDCNGNPPSSYYFNTANNGAGGVLPGGSPDHSWMVSSSLAGPYSPAIVMSPVPGRYYSSPWANSGWISFDAPGFHSYEGGDVDYYFKINFLLPCFNLCGLSYATTGVFCLTLDYFTDNSIYEIWVNGVPQSSIIGTIPLADPYYNLGYNESGKLTASLCQNWKPGLNEIILRVSSGPDHLALLVQSSTSTLPMPSATINGTTSVCRGSSPPDIIITGAGVPPFTFTYTINDGPENTLNTSGNTVSIPVSTNNLGIFKYSLISVKDANSVSCPDTINDVATVTVFPAFSFNLVADTMICPNSSITLDAGIQGATYLWSTGAITKTISVNLPGKYWVKVTIGNCFSSDSVNISMTPSLELGEDLSLCDETEVILKTNLSASYYLWSTGQTTSEITVREPGKYWVMLNYQNCSFVDSVTVIGTHSLLDVPNAFTPNCDGLNDEFKPISEGILKYIMMIFNRWGKMIFETIDVNKGWDGTYNGKLAEPGVYDWVINYRTTCSGDNDLQKLGNVMLLK